MKPYQVLDKKLNGVESKKTDENEEYYFLYTNAVSAFIIPKKSIEDLYQFETLIKENKPINPIIKNIILPIKYPAFRALYTMVGEFSWVISASL